MLAICYIIPFEVRSMTPNEQTKAALSEYDEMKDKTGKYKRYSTFDYRLMDCNHGNVRNIITQPGQFTCMKETAGGSYNRQNVYNMNPTEVHYEIVDWALSGGRLPGVDESLFFMNPFSSRCPANFPTKVGVLHNRVGNHCFYLPTAYYAET